MKQFILTAVQIQKHISLLIQCTHPYVLIHGKINGSINIERNQGGALNTFKVFKYQMFGVKSFKYHFLFSYNTSIFRYIITYAMHT